jgi:phosphoribosylanthranilate isomerase
MTKVKICGLTNLEDIDEAVKAGADYLGFILEIQKSPRNLSFEKFQNLVLKTRVLKSFLSRKIKPKIVAVLQNPNEDLLIKLSKSGTADIFQFHGKENFEELKKYQKIVKKTGYFEVSFWKVLGSEFFESKEGVEKFLEENTCGQVVDKFMLDSPKTENMESAKHVFSEIENFRFLAERGEKLVLAGGLKLQNIESFLKDLNPEIVDVSSGVEKEPGKKDLDKMKKFIQKVKEFKN